MLIDLKFCFQLIIVDYMDKWFSLCWDNSEYIKISILSPSWMVLSFYLVSSQETATIRDLSFCLWIASILDPKTSRNSISQIWIQGNGRFYPENSILGNCIKPVNQLINKNIVNAILPTNGKSVVGIFHG